MRLAVRFAWFPALLLTGGIGLLQWHSIAFWSAHVDHATGWAWSLLLEGVALWLWSDGRAVRRLLAVVATVLLLAGPLYQVSSPLFLEVVGIERSAAANTARRAALEAEIATLEKSMAAFLANSQKRVGWAERIDRTQAALDDARREMAELTTATAAAPQRLEWQRQAVIVMQATALVLIQVANVLAITTLSAARRQQLGKVSPPVSVARERPAGEGRRRRSQSGSAPSAQTSKNNTHAAPGVETALRQHLEETGLTARAFAQQHGFTPRDVSLVLHDSENAAKGRRRAPRKMVDRLQEMLTV